MHTGCNTKTDVKGLLKGPNVCRYMKVNKAK